MLLKKIRHQRTRAKRGFADPNIILRYIAFSYKYLHRNISISKKCFYLSIPPAPRIILKHYCYANSFSQSQTLLCILVNVSEGSFVLVSGIRYF